ncbi:MAG TPA: F0F1 ATP synthase subunit epsilon [Chromatiales bacterium]|nr:F0F1 ATP synthase subunit epsilon [Chromatiales bacterium]
MKPFHLHLQSATRYEHFDDVVSFVGEDDSGSFGLLANHARFMTALVFGLARLRRAGADDWLFLAVPGALLYFVDNQLTINTRQYLLDTDFRRISKHLQQELVEEETRLHDMKESLRHMEEAMIRRLWEMRREGYGRS